MDKTENTATATMLPEELLEMILLNAPLSARLVCKTWSRVHPAHLLTRNYALLRSRDLLLTPETVTTPLQSTLSPRQRFSLQITPVDITPYVHVITSPKVFLAIAHRLYWKSPDMPDPCSPDYKASPRNWKFSRWFPFTLRTVQQYRHIISWSALGANPHVPDDVLLEFADRFDWARLSRIRKLSPHVIRTQQDVVNWRMISKWQQMPLDFIHEMRDYVDWEYVSCCQVLTEDFIADHDDYVSWQDICEFQPLSTSFILRYADRVVWTAVLVHQNVTDEFYAQYLHRAVREFASPTAEVSSCPHNYRTVVVVENNTTSIRYLSGFGYAPSPQVELSELALITQPVPYSPDEVPRRQPVGTASADWVMSSLRSSVLTVNSLRTIRITDFARFEQLVDEEIRA